MKIAILTSGIQPIPAVQGGAVENLVDFYLEYNNQNKTHDITVYSVWHPEVKHHKALQSNVYQSIISFPFSKWKKSTIFEKLSFVNCWSFVSRKQRGTSPINEAQRE